MFGVPTALTVLLVLSRSTICASLRPQGAPPLPDTSSSAAPVNRRELLQSAAVGGAAIQLANFRGVAQLRPGAGNVDPPADAAARAATVFCDGPLLEAVQRARGSHNQTLHGWPPMGISRREECRHPYHTRGTCHTAKRPCNSSPNVADVRTRSESPLLGAPERAKALSRRARLSLCPRRPPTHTHI